MNGRVSSVVKLFALVAALLLVGAEMASAQAKTRTEEIEMARRDKMARLWPEYQSPLVDQINDMVERGLYEGLESGKGSNGWQLVLGGMRSGQGQTLGVGYRRSDLFRESIDFRAAARATIQKAYMFDFNFDFTKLRTERTFLNFYTAFESSPQMDYYGPGPNSLEENRSSYLYDTFNFDLNGGVEIFKGFKFGITGGFLDVHTGTGQRSGFPSTDEAFPEAPGLEEDTYYARWGAFLQADYRDNPGGPRSGGLYAVRFRRYSDEDLGQFSFQQTEFVAQQYIPYFNKTRVIALRAVAVITFEASGKEIPFYLQPKLGGNDNLRGFERYRFYDDQMIYFNVEHRWFAFSGLDMAVFVDAGKVIPNKADIDFSDLRFSGGMGFRFKMQGNYIMRIDFAYGSEGFRWMWTFSDIFKLRWHTT